MLGDVRDVPAAVYIRRAYIQTHTQSSTADSALARYVGRWHASECENKYFPPSFS